jgi:hypothetical protein
MNKLVCLVAILLSSCLSSFAQGARKDYPKFELFVGYSREITSQDTCGIYFADGSAPAHCIARNSEFIKSDADFYKPRIAINGIEASVIRNFNSYVGLKLDFSAHFKKELVTAQYAEGTTQFLAEARLYQLMAGPEFKARNKSPVTPFAYGLIGRAHSATKFTGQFAPGLPVLPAEWMTDDGLTSAIGGGLDFRVSGQTSLRSSIDFNPTRVSGAFISGGLGQTQNNIRTSIGILFR